MKKIIIGLILVIVLLTIPPLYVFAGSASCNNSNPYSCVLSDAFFFLDNAPNILLGKIVNGLNDAFNFVENPPTIILGALIKVSPDFFNFIDSITVTASQCPTCNPFITQTTSQIVLLTNTVTNTIITGLVLPILYIIGVMYFCIRLNIREFPIILGVSCFVFLGLVYIGILPTFAVIFPVIFGSVVISLIVSKWLGARGTAET